VSGNGFYGAMRTLIVCENSFLIKDAQEDMAGERLKA
jgi:hypothetical protein